MPLRLLTFSLKSTIFPLSNFYSVGWAEETSPSASHRSVRDSLPSYGSCQPSSCNLTVSSLHRKIKFLPVSRLTCCLYELTHPLRSILITRASSLLRDDPPPSHASILSPFVRYTYRVFSYHHVKSSYVLQKSPNQARANYTPGAA
jgi:hypothetical protein